MALKLSEIAEILPKGSITEEDFTRPEGEWVLSLDWERIVAELKGGELPADHAWFLGKVADTEDRTDVYAEWPLAIKGGDPKRADFVRNTWMPQEYWHALVTRAIHDLALGFEVSSLEASRCSADIMVGVIRKAGTKALQYFGGRVMPRTLQAAVSLKGAANEQLTNLIYAMERSWLAMNGFPATAQALVTPMQQEPIHFRQYADNANADLEDSPLLTAVMRWEMVRDTSAVGDEIRTPEESARMKAHLLAIDADSVKKRVGIIDKEFQKRIPAMVGITPTLNRFMAA